MQATKPLLAKAIDARPEGLVIILDDRRLMVAWERCSPRLAHASFEERRRAELSPGGYGIHWPLLDEDLSVGGLVQRNIHVES